MHRSRSTSAMSMRAGSTMASSPPSPFPVSSGLRAMLTVPSIGSGPRRKLKPDSSRHLIWFPLFRWSREPFRLESISRLYYVNFEWDLI
ncbi:40S ribosomal protein S21-like [Iris pallida]|uniref:40S ribosomal protein S21-like n=1 Tax=Iris pallida TaxID=29817 RepID=A0AAX6I640_IRIPA|nr:40S ribosomal protein S21-like [Iris pallida]